ncbi:MAG: RagB/SusD family nutrient uptake outer membrane protein [Tannerellaceae bacterium]|jgi:hypothetical protein|nr:RagB/SusD family nutrient uptake outer membrane protein [Tannerellaceae bacterium]
MKRINLFTICALYLSMLLSCEAGFMDKYPTTEITDKEFFNTVTDLETYTNGFYGYIPAVYADHGSDNISVHTGAVSTDQMVVSMDQIVIGNVSSSNIKGWNNWDKLRSINFFLVNAAKAAGAPADVDHFVGIAKFFRAKFYFEKVCLYSDVPWYGQPMDTDDERLYKAADPRTLVVDSILGDLQFAVDHIKPDLKTRTRINRYAALALMARVCLHEGTFRKYHPELGLMDKSAPLLEKAVWACEQIMNSGEFMVYGNSAADFGALFASPSLENNREIILQQASSKDLGVTTNTNTVLNWQWSLSRSLMESFLMSDGSPFTQVDGYDRKTYTEVFANRDPRMAETFCFPGFRTTEESLPELPSIKFGGYGQIKYYPKDPALRGGWNNDYTSLPIFRLGEILLVYAEAKAELGLLSQADLDKSLNLLRDRVGMPRMDMGRANTIVDPVLAAYYPNVAGASRGVLLEIRRERRVELACEGFRANDLKRWAAGEHFADNNQGVYIPYLGAYDMSGDNEPDLAILASPGETSPIDHLTEEQKTRLSYYYLKTKDGADDGFYLSEGTKGFVCFTAYRKNPRSFVSPKYYYLPIPKQQLLLNPKLTQPFGWE